jgi:hypothetical protein
MDEQRSRKRVKTMSEPESWYKHQRAKTPAIPAKIESPESCYIHTDSEHYRAAGKLKPYKDESGTVFPIDNIIELVPAVNRYLKKCEKGRAFKTHCYNGSSETASIPAGLHMYMPPASITDSLAQDALRDMQLLYIHPRYTRDPSIHMIKANSSPTNKILFYSREKTSPSFMEVIRILQTETPRLAEYAMVYFNVVQKILGASDKEMESVALTLVHYDITAGLNPHIDTVHLFGGTLGPIFTVAMGYSTKMLDLLPVLLPPSERPVRLFSNPNEIMVMDGPSRILWAHAKPWGNTTEQYTLVFKFPELTRKIKTESFVFEDTPLNIPYYIE